MHNSKISAVVHTYNSESFLAECLESLSWCDEIVVIDMHSTDKTQEIAETAGAKLYLHENVGYADPARQFGIQKCSHDWILSVDSDEIIPGALSKKITHFLNAPDADVVYLCFRNFFFGQELRGSGWSYKNLYVPRLFKKERLSYGDQVHNFVQIDPGAKVQKWIDFDLAIIHFNYFSIEHFISKLNRYTTLEALKLNQKSNVVASLTYQFFREFFGRFIVLKGYKDGWLGMYLSFAMAFYRWTSIAKANLQNESQNIKTYKEIAQRTNQLGSDQ